MAAKDFSSRIKQTTNEERARAMARLSKENSNDEAEIIMKPIDSTSFTGETKQNHVVSDKEMYGLDVDVTKLSTNPYNARVFYDDSRIEEIASSIEANGQMVSIVITDNPSKPGEYWIIDGEFRFRAIKFLNRLSIKCDYYPGVAGFDLYELSNLLNKDRTEQTCFDDAGAWQKLIDEGVVKDQAELSLHIGKDKGTVAKVMSLNALSHDVAGMLSIGKVGFSVSYEIVRLSRLVDESELIDVAHKAISGEISRKDIIAKIEKLNKPATAIQRNTMKTTPILSLKGKKVGSVRYDSKKITVDFSCANEDKSAIIAQKIAELLKEHAE